MSSPDPSPPTGPRGGERAAPGQSSPRILLLDDEPAVRQLVARCLAESGYEVVTLDDPLTALEFVSERGCDLVITNSEMPGISGAQLVVQLRRQFQTLPVLHLDDQAHPRAREFPADVPTLKKPFAHDDLRDCVLQLLKR